MNLTDNERTLFGIIRKYATENCTTPKRDRLWERSGLPKEEFSRCMRRLRDAGFIDVMGSGISTQYGVTTRNGWRWTRQRVAPRTEVPGVDAYGGGEIARMVDREAAEKLIAKLYQGVRYENISRKEAAVVRAR